MVIQASTIVVNHMAKGSVQRSVVFCQNRRITFHGDAQNDMTATDMCPIVCGPDHQWWTNHPTSVEESSGLPDLCPMPKVPSSPLNKKEVRPKVGYPVTPKMLTPLTL